MWHAWVSGARPFKVLDLNLDGFGAGFWGVLDLELQSSEG